MLRRLGLICALFSLMIAVVDCGGSKNDSSSTTSSNVDQSTNHTNAQPVGFADASRNLVDQDSYVMTAELSNLSGPLASIPGITDPTTIKFERTGADRKVQMIASTGRALLKLWRVDGQLYVDFGFGPTKSSANQSPAKELAPLLDADQQIIEGLAKQDATFTVTGSEKVNGIQSTVETARYDLPQQSDSFFAIGSGASVDAKIWVAQDGGYLTKADLTLNAGDSGTADTEASAHVVIDVTDIGKANEIKAPL